MQSVNSRRQTLKLCFDALVVVSFRKILCPETVRCGKMFCFPELADLPSSYGILCSRTLDYIRGLNYNIYHILTVSSMNLKEKQQSERNINR